MPLLAALVASLDDITTWLWLGLAAALVALFVYVGRHFFCLRLPNWLFTHLFYRLRVTGLQNVPTDGPALLVCNHISPIDAGLIFASFRRPVRFVLWAPFLKSWILRPFFRLARVIPIDANAGPRAIIEGLRAASDALEQGELVCIFAEEGITRSGFQLPFHRGLEQIGKRFPAPIIPVCLDNIWGSIFSYHGGRFYWNWPQRLRYPVTVAFGKPLLPTASAAEVRQAIHQLSAECSIRRREERLPLHRQFLRQAVRHPLRMCYLDPNNAIKKRFRYGEVLTGVKLLFGLLKPMLGSSPMVGLWLPPSVGGAMANLAIAVLRKTAVNLNYTANVESIHSALRQCGIRHVLTSRLFVSKVPIDVPDGVELIYLEDFRKVISKWQRIRTLLGVLLLPRFVQERQLNLTDHQMTDLAAVIFSSGSTGDPKGVMLTHDNVVANTESMIQAINLRATDRLLGVLPFFHSFGYTVTLWAPLQVGASSVYFPDPRQAKEIGELCKSQQCNVFLTTPTFLRMCVRRCEPGDFKTLRVLEVGAEKLPPSLAKEFETRFGIVPTEGYGCTELSPAAAANWPDWELDGLRQMANKPGTIGQPLPGVACKIVHPETMEPLPLGQEGVLLVHGANVMQGYLGKPELTKQVLRDGWYVTGDIARFDNDGFLTITDRLSRFSKVAGEMVPHQKIEDSLHEIVGSVERTFVVTGVPDESKGERLVVLHVALIEVEVKQLWQQLMGKGLPNLWVPRERDFFLIAEMPILGTGKLDLKRCKEIALERARG